VVEWSEKESAAFAKNCIKASAVFVSQHLQHLVISKLIAQTQKWFDFCASHWLQLKQKQRAHCVRRRRAFAAVSLCFSTSGWQSESPSADAHHGRPAARERAPAAIANRTVTLQESTESARRQRAVQGEQTHTRHTWTHRRRAQSSRQINPSLCASHKGWCFSGF
jgi:hypothetical protein